jgi:twitching motility protein PilT
MFSRWLRSWLNFRNFLAGPAFTPAGMNGISIDTLIALAKEEGASDLHLEAGLPAALRVRGSLRTVGDPVSPNVLLEMAREVIGREQWPVFLERRSYDLSRTICGVRCRINVLQTARGVGFAIRLLASFQATIEKLNLHPDLKKLVSHSNGLILLTGPTGCGKSSTMAALIQEMNLTEARHIVTIESPIEYTFRPRLAYIRQREVGRDTPSFEQALIDALREDPDVLMVGEMRDPATMQLTLTASETGHLVLATMHSSTCAEALQRLTSAFPAEIQSAVRAQLADCLVAVVSQRLRYRADQKIRVPELEILLPSAAVRSYIRAGDFFKIAQIMEIGAEHGMWTWSRYANWLDKKRDWHISNGSEPADSDPTDTTPPSVLPSRPGAGGIWNAPSNLDGQSEDKLSTSHRRSSIAKRPGPIEIEPVEGGLTELIRKLDVA